MDLGLQVVEYLRLNRSFKVQTAKHAKHAKEQGVVVTKAFTRLVQRVSASIRSGFVWFAFFAVPTAEFGIIGPGPFDSVLAPRAMAIAAHGTIRVREPV